MDHSGESRTLSSPSSPNRLLSNRTEYRREKGQELTIQEILTAFTNAYTSTDAAFQLGNEYRVRTSSSGKSFEGVVVHKGVDKHLTGTGNGPVSALIDALGQYTGIQLDVRELVEHAIGKGKNTRAAAYIELTAAEHGEKGFWGVGIDEDTVLIFNLSF